MCQGRLQFLPFSDLYVLHFAEVPCWFDKKPRDVREDTWRELEKLYEAGES